MQVPTPRMPIRFLPAICVLVVTSLASLQTASAGPSVYEKSILLDGTGSYKILEASLAGEQLIEYVVTGRRRQILSVDIQPTIGTAYFNVLPEQSEQALFTGATDGNVADVRLPETGNYRVRVYQVRAAARRGATATFTLGVGLGAPEFADGLSGGPDYWQVTVTDGGALNLRNGPSTRYAVIGALRMGDPLQNRGCRLTGQERWCLVRSSNSGLSGWAAGQYLQEGPAPRAPQAMPGGPVGNGQPFDATGYISCTREGSESSEQAPFGVIRQGGGNAGIWAVFSDSTERHLLFENGDPVALTPGGLFAHERQDDTTVVSFSGYECQIPDVVVYGG